MKLYKVSTYFEIFKTTSNIVKSLPFSLDSQNIIFCEDKLTLSIEQQIASDLGGSFNTNVYTFGRFINKYGKIKQTLSKSGSVMAIKKILLENKDSLVCFSAEKSGSTLPETLFDLIAQLKSAKVTPQDLYNTLNDISGAFKNKVRDIYTIFNGYENFLKENNLVDGNNYLSQLASLIENSQLIENANVIIAGYSSLTKQSAEIISILNKKAKTFSAVIVGGKNEEIYTNEMYNFLTKNFATVEEVTLPSLLNSEATALRDKLFNPSIFKQKDGLYVDKTHIYQAKDYTNEIEHVAKIIRYNVINKGARYYNFALAVGNVNEYKNAIENTFKSFDIPYFVDEKKKLANHPLSKMILLFLTVSIRNFDVNVINELIDNVVLLPNKKDADDFNLYLKQRLVTRKTFKLPFENSTNLIIEGIRNSICYNANLFKQKDTAINYCSYIRKLLKNVNASDNLQIISKSLENLGELTEKSFNDQALENVESVLVEIESILNNQIISIEDFKAVFTTGISANEISVIPQFVDSVYVGELKDCRFKQFDHMFILGLTGDIPFTKSDTSLLTDNDLNGLEKLKVSIDPKISIVNKREKQSVAIALLSFKNSLYLSYSLLSGSGASLTKSRLIDYVLEIFNNKERPLKVLNYNSFVDDNYYANEKLNKIISSNYLSKEQAFQSLAKDTDSYANKLTDSISGATSFYKALEKASNREDILLADKIINNVTKEDKIYLNDSLDVIFKNDEISATTLETYFSCPYKNFLSRALNLQEEISTDVKANEIGNIIHKLFEKIILEIDKFDTDKQLIEAVLNILEEILQDEDYARYLNKEKSKNTLEMLKKECIKTAIKVKNELKNSLFKPIGVEVRFADYDEKHKAIKLKGANKEYKVNGKVDRIDKYNDYIRIIDYKTGNQEDSDEKLYTGNKLQLYLYMNAFINSDNNPAGVYYYSIKDKYVKENDDNYSFLGKTLNDDMIINATDTSISSSNKSSIVKIGKTTTLSPSEMKDYLEYAKLVAEKGIEEIEKGVIAKSPYESCSYCSYVGLCDLSPDRTECFRKVKGVRKEKIINATKENK